MKKFLSLAVVVLVAIGLAGCIGSKRDVAKFSITMNDATGIAVVSFVPDYGKRTLSVDYKNDSFDKKQQSVATTGQIGGDNFDKFEAMVKIVRNYKVIEGSIVDEKKPNLSARIEDKDKNNVSMKVGIENPDQNVKELMDFYYFIIQLLTGATHV